MRRLSILFSIALVFALFVVAAATAAAPDFCDEKDPKFNPNHPSCATTTTTQPPEIKACETTMPISGDGNVIHNCLWTPTDDDSVVGTVTVSNIEGGIKKAPVVFVRDDDPGDVCALEEGWVGKRGEDYEVSFKLVYDTVPVGYEVDYTAWLGASYWDFEYDPEDSNVGAHWCAPQDFVLDSLRLDTNGTPLHLSVRFNAGKGGQLVITLFPGQDPLVP